jgi:integrase
MRGQGTVYRRSGTSAVWIAYWFRGKQYREPGGKNEAEARRKLKARLKEIAADRFIGPQDERVTVDELLNDLIIHLRNKGAKAVPKLQSHLMAVRAFFSLRRASEVTTPLVERYIKERLDAGKARSTVNREVEALKQAFTNASRQTPPRVARVPYFPRLTVENARQGFVSRAEFDALIAGIDDLDVRDFAEWCFWTGMRKGEAAALTWENFDRETWTVRLHAKDAKTGYGRVLALDGPLRSIVERRLKVRRLDCSLIFHRTSRGKAAQPVKDIRKSWNAAARAAGLGGVLFHDLRRSAIRNMIRAGVDPAVAMRVSGHRTRSVFDRYNIVSEEDLRAAITKTAEYVSTLPKERIVVPMTRPDNAR